MAGVPDDGSSNSEQTKIIPILNDLKEVLENLPTDETYREDIAAELSGLGYDCSQRDDPINSENVTRLLRKAIDDVFVNCTELVDIKNENFEELQKQLEELLQPKLYFHKLNMTKENFAGLTSPLDLAKKVKILKNASQKFVAQLIESQFRIKWATASGEPDDFKFVDFCDAEELSAAPDREKEAKGGKTKHLHYIPRKAHVRVQLYKYIRTQHEVPNYETKDFCPPVHIKINGEWKKFCNLESMESTQPTFLDWMHEKISDYIEAHAQNHENKDAENKYAKDILKKPTLYWVVLDDSQSFSPGNHLQLHEIGKSQVYVGRSMNGIKGRWLNDGNNHCATMSRCLDQVKAMTEFSYTPHMLSNFYLVDLRLLLAKLKKENCALFVMKTYNPDDPVEEEILENEEKLNINGKYTEQKKEETCIKLENHPLEWMPINMAYGMNCK